MISEDNKELADMQRKQLEILHELDRVCQLCGIHYCLASGTCLGAVRHKGFIPWDDDVDVYMQWEDAEKLLKNQNLFQNKYFVQCRKSDNNVKTTHYRLRDSSTSCFLEEDQNLDINHGIFIDIYILYPYPDNFLRAHKLIIDSFIYRILVSGISPRNHGRAVQVIGKVILRMYKGKNRKKKIECVESCYKHNGGKKYLATYFGRDATPFHSIVYPKEWFMYPSMLQFEDLMAPCPKEAGRYCELQYGSDYMKLPPVEKRTPHHDYIFANAEEPYIKYKGIYYLK